MGIVVFYIPIYAPIAQLVDPPAGGLLSQMFKVYAIYNRERDKIYIGQTDNIELRLARHNKFLSNKSTSFTSKNSGEWVLIYSEDCQSRKDALKREKELKSYQGRLFIKSQIQK